MMSEMKPADSIHPRGIVPPYMLEQMECHRRHQEIADGLARLAEKKPAIDNVTHWQEADCDTHHTIEKNKGDSNE